MLNQAVVGWLVGWLVGSKLIFILEILFIGLRLVNHELYPTTSEQRAPQFARSCQHTLGVYFTV